ncbi:MAG: hypothetical protein V1701_00895 [Planctomycetota bacterium]
MSRLKKEINELGKRLVRCNLKCEGVNNNPKQGIIPRCLVLAEGKGKGCVIVGINPGRIGKSKKGDSERKAGREGNYKVWLDWFRKRFNPDKNDYKGKYYGPLARMVRKLGLKGPILWTELVKCQNASDKKPTVQTFRVCIKKYLLKEIELTPKSWPIIAVSKKAFDILPYLFPSRIVIGVPHPASYGYFKKVLDKNIRPRRLLKNGLATWIGVK